MHKNDKVIRRYSEPFKLKILAELSTGKYTKSDIQKIAKIGIGLVDIKPDYDRFQIINSVIQPIHTDWEEINQLQSNLIQDLERS